MGRKKSTTDGKKKTLPRGIRERTYTGTDGKTHTRYERRFMWQGVRYSAYGDTPTKAENAADDMRLELKAGTYRKNNAVTLNGYFEEWKEQKAANVGAATLNLYEKRYRYYLKRPLGRFKVTDLERRQIAKVFRAVAERVSVNAANDARGLLFQILKAAVYDGIIAANVVATIPPLKERSEKAAARDTIHRALTDEEIKAFMGAAAHSWYFHAFQFMLATGTRAGECMGLEWRDIDTQRAVIHVRRTATRDATGKAILGDTTKTKRSRRDIPMNGEIMAILEKQKEQCTAFFGNVIAIDGLVFPNESGNFAAPGVLNRCILQAVDRYNAANDSKPKAERGATLKRFSSHAFRDTFASKAAADGVPLNVLKELLGHSSYAMTADLYGHIYEEQKREAMGGLKIVVM